MAEGTGSLAAPRPQIPVKGFWGIFVVSFVVFLAVAVLAQIVTRDWRSWLPGAEGGQSVIGGVKASVYTFMSYLS